MASEDSVKIANSNAEDGAKEGQKDFRRKLPYDPAVLKRRKLWSKDQLSKDDMSGRVFSRVGSPGTANGRDSLVGTMTSHQGDRTTNPPDSKHKEGNTLKYGPTDKSGTFPRSHSARDNNSAGFRDNARASLGAKAQYPSQPLSSGGRGLGDANKKYVSDRSAVFQSRSHSSRDNNGAGVRTTPGGNQQYPMQSIRRARGGLSNVTQSRWVGDSPRHHTGQANPAPPAQNADPGLKYAPEAVSSGKFDSRHHLAHDQAEYRSVKLQRSDNTLNRRSL